jgi:starch synthase
VHFSFNNELSHLSAAGADFLLMPSRFEPCGLSQMYSMVYGAPPVVRATGGLKDSVKQYVEGEMGGTGFLFQDATAVALYEVIRWACSIYYDRPEEYAAIQRSGMRGDFSWEVSAGVYEDIYGWAIDARNAAFGD